MEFVAANEQGYNATQPSKLNAGSPKMETLAANTRDVQLPLSADSWAVLRAPFPLDERAWEQMMTVLNAMKPALVGMQRPKPEPDPDGGE